MRELIKLLNLPASIVAITQTSDGFYIGMKKGDCGFNWFFGKPRFGPGPGQDQSRRTWKAFTFAQRRRAVKAARKFNRNLLFVMLRGAKIYA